MGDKNPDKIYERKLTTSERIRKFLDVAEDTFWSQAYAAFPECQTGDLEPSEDGRLRAALRSVIESWYAVNRPKASMARVAIGAEAVGVASRELRVVLRLPKKGERCWWVSAESAHDPEAALAEVLAQSEELGFPAGRDITPADSPDENGMVAVTIEIARAS